MKLLPLVVVGFLLTASLSVGAMVPATGDVSQLADGASPSQVETQTERDDDEIPEGEMTNVLSIPESDIDRSELRRHHVDLGPAADFDTAATTDQLATSTIERELEGADEAEREQRIDQELSEIESTIETLDERERNAIRGFNANQLEPREFITELASIHYAASTLRERTQMLDQQAESIESDVASNERLTTIEYDLRMRQGPVRAYAADILRAEQPADRVSLETGDDSISLTAIEDDLYLREVHRPELRGSGGSELSVDRAEEIVQEQYPILWNQSSRSNIDGPGSVLSVELTSGDLQNGGFQAFVDGDTEAVFREHQRLPLSLIVASEQTTKLQAGLEVTVRQTYAGGPLELTVTDSSSGDPVDATVTIGQNGEESETIGETNVDGELWTLTPRGEFTVTVLGDNNAAAFVDITPQDPRTAIDSSRAAS